jgi:hypothetical protein
MKKQVIYLITDSEMYVKSQIEEIEKLFKRYDIRIIPNIMVKTPQDIQILLEKQIDEETEILAALLIQNKIHIENNISQQALTLIPAQDECMVYSYKLKDGQLVANSFQYTTDGYIIDVLNSKTDKHFILKNSLHTYAELDQLQMKNTSQGLAVSKFICEEVYYPSPINLNFNPQEQQRSVDFRNDPANFLNKNIYFNNSYAINYGLTNLFHTVLNKGIFFRSAKNRREKNYWCPALNAGIPLVPKRDVIHEVTYMAHDFGHFLIPDLLYTGNHSAQTQQIYIAYRMMSEAFTLVLADMIFVDSLKKSGFEYDYTRRRIYPLFEEFNIDLTRKESYLSNVENMLRASVYYCLKGDDTNFINLSYKHRKNADNLNNFKQKYMKFFCEDFKWTKTNYKYFQSKSDEIKKWWELVAPLRSMAKLDLETVEEFSSNIQDDLIDDIFNVLFSRVSVVLLKQPVEIDIFEKRKKFAFFKYMMGQMMIFVRYENVVRESKAFQRIMMNYLCNIKENISHDDIDFCRNTFSEYVDILLDKNLINQDDALTFKEVFPVFEPSFAFYDEKTDFYKDLSSVAYDSIYMD